MKTYDEIYELILEGRVPSLLATEDIGLTDEEESEIGCDEIGGNDEIGWIGWLYCAGSEDTCTVGPFQKREKVIVALRDAIQAERKFSNNP